jgi:hypothetical protein
MVKFENAHREQMETVRTAYGTHGKACGLSLSWTTWKHIRNTIRHIIGNL